MATEKNLSNLVINKVENQAVYEQMKIKNLINSDELYFVAGADEVATETTDGLMSAEDKIKLDGIEEGAEVNVQSDWNITDTSSDAYIKNKPAALPANGGNASTVNGHTVETNVPANAVFTDTTYEKATQNKSGLMSASDKLKLDDIDENANYIAVDSSLNSNSTNPVQNKIVKQAIDQRAPLSHTHTVSEVTNIAEVAKTGSYNDLTNKPTIPTKVSQLINDKSYVQQSQLPTKLSAFENDSDFIDTTVDNLVNYYTKTNTYSKTEVNNLINTIPTMSIKIVDSLPETGSSKNIYLVSAETTENNNYYNEYLWTGTAYEMIGSTKVNLDGYLTSTGDSSNTSTQFTMAGSRILPQSGEILSVIFGKVVKYLNDLHSIAFSGSFNDLQDLNGKGLSTNDYTTAEKNKLSNIENGANKTVVDTALSSTSTNPVQNKVINTKFNTIQSNIDNKVPTSRTVNGKALSSNISLSAADVGALPNSTEIPSIDGLATETYVNTAVRKAAPWNLLDNSNFTSLVYQAGIGGSHGTITYAVDRWILDSGTVSKADVGLTLNGTIRQKLESPPTGETSAFVGMVSGTASISYADGAVTITSSGGVLKWAALYDGVYSAATMPEYRPKGYGVELMECRKYFYRYESGNNGAYVPIAAGTTLIPGFTFPIPMRAFPSIDKFKVRTWTTVGFTDITSSVSSKGFNAISLKYIELNKSLGSSGLAEITADFIADL